MKKQPPPRVDRARAFFFLALALCPGRALALGKLDWDLELDAYYSAFGVTIPFQKDADTTDVDKAEADTYRDMAVKAFWPRFAVVELGVNPLPIAGVLIRKHAPGFYSDAQLSPSFNLVRSVTTAFEDPYGVSLFLGKVVDFDQGRKRIGRAQKGYAGYLVSFGDYHILDNQLIADNWVETEWKLKGDMKTDARRMSWSFAGGHKFHGNREIEDTFYFAVRRSRTDFTPVAYSFWLSTAIDYRVDFSHERFQAIRHRLVVSKNFPETKHKLTFSLGVGVLHESGGKYSGSLADRRIGPRTSVILQPNMKF